MTDGIPRSADIDLDMFYDLVFGLRLERPDPGSTLPDRFGSASHIPVSLEAPFGPTGPMLFRFGDILSLLFGWSTVQSGMRVSDPDHLLFDYTRVMMGFRLFRPAPKHIEMIGLGGGSLAKACYRSLPDCDITVIEIDPEVIALRQQFHIPPDDHRFRVICADGVDYLATTAGKPDILFIDGFDSKGLSPTLSQQAFYHNCCARLGPDGLLVANLCDNNMAFATLVRRIAASFNGRAIAVPAERRGNRVVFASSDPSFPPSLELIDSAAQRLGLADMVNYSIKAKRIKQALRRWIMRKPERQNFPNFY